MQPTAGVLSAPFVEDLAAAMCRAQGPPQALSVAAAAVQQQLPSLTFVGLAIIAQDRQSVRYTILHSKRPSAARLGPAAASSCAAGLAIDTKQPVHVRDLRHGDLGFHDLQYLQQEHEACACFVVPLVVADNALGALSMAALQADAFAGHEPWLHVIAAMCAPYVLLLRSHEGLLALEGLVGQVLPMRVALQLQDRQRRSSTLGLPPGAAQQQQLPLVAGAEAASTPGPLAAPGASSNQPQGVQGVNPPAAEGVQASSGFSRSGSSLRQLRARQRTQQQPLQPALHSTVPRNPQRHMAEDQRPQMQLPAAARASVALNVLGFSQPRLEQAYRQWALQQWQRVLDTVFLLLVLLSAFGSNFKHCIAAVYELQQQPYLQLSDRLLTECALSLFLVLVWLWLLHAVQQQPAQRYLQWRVPAVALSRVLRTVLFCVEVWQLQPIVKRSSDRHQTASSTGVASAAVGSIPITQAAACGLLMMLGVLGHLPAALHVVVQAACLALVALTFAVVQLPSLISLSAVDGVAGVLMAMLQSLASASWSSLFWLVMAGGAAAFTAGGWPGVGCTALLFAAD